MLGKNALVWASCFSFSTFLLLTTVSCGGNARGTAPGLPPPPVEYVVVAKQDVPIYAEYAAQTYARDAVEIRGRVDGFIEKRSFQIGSDVQAGQPLYILDLRPYQADVEKAKGDLAQSEANLQFANKQVALIQAQADLAQAKANLVKAKQDVERLRPLVKEEAAPQQDLDNAAAALDANQANVDAKEANVQQNRLSTKAQIDTTAAQVESNKALLRNAELNLEYATIRSPISGRVGDSLIEVGGLVTKTSPQPLTTVIPLDPIWVRFKVSESEYLDYQKRSDRSDLSKLPLELLLANNTVHPYPGHIQNSVNQVDQKTGTLELQATFPNPQHNLLPGQFGRVRVRVNERHGVITVPQRAVLELQGLQSVLTIDDHNIVVPRGVVTSDRVGEQWIVDQGLKPGDKVIVEGVLKARPGSPVNPKESKQEPSPEGAAKS